MTSDPVSGRGVAAGLSEAAPPVIAAMGADLAGRWSGREAAEVYMGNNLPQAKKSINS